MNLYDSDRDNFFLKKHRSLTVKISKSIRLITPFLSPPLREGSDRKTVKQKIMHIFAMVMCPGLEPVLPSGRLSFKKMMIPCYLP